MLKYYPEKVLTSAEAHDLEEGHAFKLQERYKFNFSTRRELAGQPSICRIVTIILLVIATLILPVAILIDRKDVHVNWYFPWNSWLIYVIIVNTTFLMVMGAYLASTAAYPYSNSLLARNLTVQTNRRFGLEFIRCIDRMVLSIRDMCETQSHEKSGAIFADIDPRSSMQSLRSTEASYDLNDKNTSKQFLSARDVYMRVAQNLELIDLYYKVNRQIIGDDPK